MYPSTPLNLAPPSPRGLTTEGTHEDPKPSALRSARCSPSRPAPRAHGGQRQHQAAVPDAGRRRAVRRSPGEDPAAAMQEMKDLGVDVLRTNVLFYRVYDDFTDRTQAGRVRPERPELAPYYAWAPTDRIVSPARGERHQDPRSRSAARARSGPPTSPASAAAAASARGSRTRSSSGSSSRPSPSATAASVDWYSIYNEPNIGTSSGGPGG